jgi:neutral ceramidase
MIGGFLSLPTKEQIACQHPKPILLNTGNAKLPYQWDPSSVPVSVFRIGQLFILNVPGEFTTMAGRRLRRAIRGLVVANGINDPVITIAGLANSYTHYITTFEEYAGQRYEAASTLYGPHTLSAYIQEIERITKHLLDDTPAASDKPPDDLSSKQISLLPPVVVDIVGLGKKVSSHLRHLNHISMTFL